MKAQDVLFLIILMISLIRKRDSFVILGLLCFVFSACLFGIGNLFTAQRLTWYGAGYVLIAVLLELMDELKRFFKKNGTPTKL